MKRIAGALAAMLLALTGAQCQPLSVSRAPASQPRYAELPPVPDRLRTFYQELQAGKFEVLADLETPAQAQIFRVEGAGQARLTVRKSRLATGAGALEVKLEEPAASLVVDDQQARDWALPHHWSQYELLLASIYAPAPAVASLQIRSGTEQPATWEAPPLPLQPGWNLVRIDLADVARQVNLADVRQIRLAIKADTWPFTFHLDDLILADNSACVYGNPKGEEGSLYVLKKGRRLHVGAAKRFELVFARGLLAGWYDLSSDPDKSVNLAGSGPAGPVLTALDATGAPLGAVGIDSWTHLGKSVQTQQQIVETNSLAVTIKGTIRFAGTGADGVDSLSGPTATLPAASQPSTGPSTPGAIEHTYLYTIRRDGRIFLDIQARVASGQFTPAGLGLAITSLQSVLESKQVDPLDRSLLDHQGQAAAAAPTSAPASAPAGTFAVVEPAQAMASAEVNLPVPRALLLTRSRTSGTNLLLVPSSVALYQRTVSAVRQTGETAAHMYVMSKAPSDNVHLAAMLAVWPPDLKDLPTAAAVARDYQEPTPPTVQVGRLRTDTDGDLDGDGFAEALGRWVLEPDGQILRLRWPAGQLRFWPMLQITGLKGKACWPYLDGRVIKPVEKRANGDALFVVPEILSRAALLEVTVEK